jgi:hypothetical protein
MTGRLRPFVSKVIRLIVVTCLGGFLPSAALAQTIVWTDANAQKIQRKEVSGGAVTTIVQFPPSQFAEQIHYDPITAKLYYRFFPPSGPSVFQRANLDGSQPENIPTPSLGNFTLNVELRKLYWINFDTMYRSDLDGTGVESHTYPICCIFALIAVGDDLFFGASGDMGKGVWRADADGSNEQFLHESGAPRDLAYDPVENKLYLATLDDIDRLNPDGSGFELVVFDSVPTYIAVDYQGRKLYWIHYGARVIRRSNLDGSNVEDFVTPGDAGNPAIEFRGLTIVYNSLPLIPAASGWGLGAMALILLGAGLVVLRKRPASRFLATSPPQA